MGAIIGPSIGAKMTSLMVSVFTGPESGRVGLTPVKFFGGGLARAKGDPNLGAQVCHIKVTCGGAGAQGCL